MAAFVADAENAISVRAADRAAALVLTSLIFALGLGKGTEIRVMTSGAFTAAYLELKPEFESVTQVKVVTLATSMGTGQDSIPNRLERELVDVVVVDDSTLEALIKDGRVKADSKVPLACSSIGMAVRAGTPKPGISSIEALKRTLLAAKSIAYSASISGDYVSTEMFGRLGIADQVAAKSRRIERERVGAVVARGEAEIGFQQVSELLPIQESLCWTFTARDSKGQCRCSRIVRCEYEGAGWRNESYRVLLLLY